MILKLTDYRNVNITTGFPDSDVAKWIESASYVLAKQKDAAPEDKEDKEDKIEHNFAFANRGENSMQVRLRRA